MRKDKQKSFRDACLWVSWTLLITIINIFSSNLYLFIWFFCFLLHYTLGLALTDQVTSALLPSHHALIMVCFWSPVTTSQQVRGASRLHKLIYNQIPRTFQILFFCQGMSWGVIWLWISRGGVLPHEPPSVSRCWSWNAEAAFRLSSKWWPRKLILTEIFIGWRPFRIRMWSSAATQLII